MKYVRFDILLQHNYNFHKFKILFENDIVQTLKLYSLESDSRISEIVYSIIFNLTASNSKQIQFILNEKELFSTIFLKAITENNPKVEIFFFFL